jgi:serine/threonine protein kinase
MLLSDLDIEHVIGRGSFGVISKVVHKETQQHFALKKITKQYVSCLSQKLKRFLKLLRMLRLLPV